MIQFKNIIKAYKDRLALDDVSFTFNEGEVIVLKGVSGSGKSTILSLIAGLLKPTSGEVIVDGKKISKLADHFAANYRRKNIGFIFQKYNLIPDLSVKENVLLPLIPENLEKGELNHRLKLTLQSLGLSDKSENIVKKLSGGEQQRVAIARANVNTPKIILADEPTANLDAKLSLEFIEIIREMKRANRTIIIATHDPLFFDLDFVDAVVEVENGKLL